MPSFRWYKKRGRKIAAKAYGYAKKRYAPAGKIDVGRIAKDVSKIKGLLNTELKHSTMQLSNNIFVPPIALDASNMYELTALTQDNTGSGRNGLSVRFKSLQLRGKFTADPGWLNNNVHKAVRYRVTVFIDKESYPTPGIQPSSLYYSGSLPVGLDDMRNWESLLAKRYSILYNRVFVLDNDNPERLFNFYKKLHMQSRYTQGSNFAINNKIYLMISADQADVVQQTMDYRVTYVDN